MNLEKVLQSQKKPEPFTPGEPHFWDDPYISSQMLKAHLDPTNDLASRRPEKIQASVDWLITTLGLQAGHTVLDLGCGPGLYSARMAEKGLQVTGVDYSRRSIEYAMQYASQHRLDIDYRYQDYLTLKDDSLYDAVLLIYGDYCPLSPTQRSTLLENVRRALKPGGVFVFDVTTRTHRKIHCNRNSWYAAEQGFWKPGPHLVLEEGFDYPEQDIYLDQATVVEQNDKITVYRNWFQDFSRQSITAELEQAGFKVLGVWNDLLGTPYTDDTEWIGLITSKF